MPANSADPNDLFTYALVEALRALPTLRGKQWSVSPLAGGITNRNFLIQVEGSDGGAGEALVLRIAGAGTELLGIDRKREFACAQVAAVCGAGCEVVAYLPEHQALVVRYAPGDPLAVGDLERPEVMARAVEAVRRFHGSGEVPGEFRPIETIHGYVLAANASGVQLPVELLSLSGRLAWVEMETQRLREVRPCHNDLLPANLIDDGERVRLIDWEYAAMGDVMFDLGNLAENHLLSEAAEIRLLELYFGEARPNETVMTADLARLWKMRFISAMREATWGYYQSEISTLDFDFVAYGRQHFDRAMHLKELIGPSVWNQSSKGER